MDAARRRQTPCQRLLGLGKELHSRKADPAFDRFFGDLTDMLIPLLPGFEREGKSYLTLAVGCTGGRHRSVYCAELLGRHLREKFGVQVEIRHLEQESAEDPVLR